MARKRDFEAIFEVELEKLLRRNQKKLTARDQVAAERNELTSARKRGQLVGKLAKSSVAKLRVKKQN